MSNPRAANEQDETVRSSSGSNEINIDANDPLVGTVFGGRYEILARVGQGGMSTVYKAKHLFMHNIVAVKVLLPNLVSQERFMLRFQQEAKAAGSVKHPNAVSIHDFGLTESGQPFLVMDYLSGASLADAIRAETRLPISRALKIFTQACDALDAAHRLGIVHRDLKPSNVMLIDENGEETVKIVDFGIAKILSPDSEDIAKLTQTGELFGSPPYMSPEQWAGGNLDARTDIYSMGCLMYETVTGRPPYVGSNMLDMMHKHVNEIPARFKDLGCPRMMQDRMEALVLKAIAKEPQDRQKSIAEVRVQLDAVSRPAGLLGAFVTFFQLISMRRRRTPAWALILLALLVPLAAETFVQVNAYVRKAEKVKAETSKFLVWYKAPLALPDRPVDQTTLRMMSQFADITERAARLKRGTTREAARNLCRYGETLFKYGMYDLATHTFFRATNLRDFDQLEYDEQLPILEGLGDASAALNRNDMAISAYTRYVQLIERERGRHVMAFHSLKSMGKLFFDKGKLEKALESYRDAEALQISRYQDYGPDDMELAEVRARIGQIEALLKQTPYEAGRFLFMSRGFAFPLTPDVQTKLIWTDNGYAFSTPHGQETKLGPRDMEVSKSIISYWNNAQYPSIQNYAFINYYLAMAFSEMTDHDAAALIGAYPVELTARAGRTARELAIHYYMETVSTFRKEPKLNRCYLADVYDRLSDLSDPATAMRYRWQAFSERAFSPDSSAILEETESNSR